ncbi:hypothetical protein BEWA_007010 [Theileria equi strain WA]|uniref:Uncharacterized protein n=1 Tax=Theileria equi strain WA TaxID=1537102 RepID=L0B0A9_THEEQ|nr:hypothetical protein BEWA_007010 [Theileria equi strain WA]AFZ81292.1 hypothetical protein BEWA_007010 [Theileria equi strain WA]|eukprot:XP_004830958.1 hypothetical protein BEWA_007010 [Theileria equi strain WA]
MIYDQTPKTKKMAVRTHLKGSSVDSELSTGTFVCTTSECSASTCDSLRNKRRKRIGSTKRVINRNISISNDDNLHSDTDSSDVAELKSEDITEDRICRRCDKLTSELTELRMQHHDTWLSNIKPLEEMLLMKESTIDRLQSEILEKDKLLLKAQKVETKKQEMDTKRRESLIKLQEEIRLLKQKNANKSIQIRELETSIKVKDDNISQLGIVIERLEKNALRDSEIIKKLRSMLENKS